MHYTSVLLPAAFALGAAAALNGTLPGSLSATRSSPPSRSAQAVYTIFDPVLTASGGYAGSVISTSASNTILAVACTSGYIEDGCYSDVTETLTVGPSTFAVTAASSGYGTAAFSCKLSGTTAGYCSAHLTLSSEGSVVTTSVGSSIGSEYIATYQQAVTITAGAITTGTSGGSSGGSSSSASTNAAATMGPLAVAGMAVPAGLAFLAAAL